MAGPRLMVMVVVVVVSVCIRRVRRRVVRGCSGRRRRRGVRRVDGRRHCAFLAAVPLGIPSRLAQAQLPSSAPWMSVSAES
jgi:hypothetical protein